MVGIENATVAECNSILFASITLVYLDMRKYRLIRLLQPVNQLHGVKIVTQSGQSITFFASKVLRGYYVNMFVNKF